MREWEASFASDLEEKERGLGEVRWGDFPASKKFQAWIICWGHDWELKICCDYRGEGQSVHSCFEINLFYFQFKWNQENIHIHLCECIYRLKKCKYNYLDGCSAVRAWNQEVCSLCGLRFKPCGCSYDGHWRLTWSLTLGPVELVEVRASWPGHPY